MFLIYPPILQGHRTFVGSLQEQVMGKEKQSTKEAKKQPLKSAKEKKAAKQAKKHGVDSIINPLHSR